MTDCQLENERIAVTGGAGFIGSHLTERLAPDNQVRVYDNLSSGTADNLPDGVTLHERDVKTLEPADFEDFDIVFHQAANVSVSRSMSEPVFDANKNVVGLIRTLEAARRAGVPRFVFASSAAVYGDPERLPVVEDDPRNPASPYAASKCAGELYCQVYDSLYDMDTVCLRYFNVFGPRQRGDSPYAGVIAIFIDNLLGGEPLTIHGDGTQTRDFVYVEDVVDANVLAATAHGVGGRVYNVGTGERVSVNSLADELESIVGATPGRLYEDERQGDVEHSQADIGKIASELEYTPSTELSEGLANTVQWYTDEYSGRTNRGE